MLQLRAASKPLRQVHQVHLRTKLLWQRGLSYIHLHPSLGRHRRRHNSISSRKCIARPSLLLYPREIRGRETQEGQGTTSHATTTIRLVTSQESAPILRKATIRTRAIRGRQMLRHARACSLHYRGRNSCWRGCYCWYVSCEPTPYNCFL